MAALLWGRGYKTHNRLHRRFFAFLSSAIVLSSLLISLIAATLYTREISENARQSGTELLHSTVNQLETYMRSLNDMAYTVMMNRSVQSALNPYSVRRASAYVSYIILNSCSYTLQLQGSLNPDIEIALFPQEAGQRWYSSLSGDLSSYQYANSAWYQAFQDDNTLQSLYLPHQPLDIEFSPLPEATHMICYRIHSLYSLNTVGYMCLYLRPAALDRLLASPSENIHNIALVDDNDVIVNSLCADFTPEELLALSTTHTDSAIVSQGGARYRLMTAEVAGTPWRVICAYGLSGAMRAALRVAGSIALTALGVCLLCIPLFWGFLTRLLKPIEQLTIGIQWVKMGRTDFSLRPKRSDELGEAIESFNDMVRQLRLNRQELQRMSELQREIQLSALRRQINPHFLYNTLDMIIGMIASGDSDASIDVCQALGGMFRYNLNGDSQVSLRQELSQIQRYIQISQLRFRDRFHVNYDIDETLLDQIVPKLILQPLVENCVVHGVSPVNRPVYLLIAFSRRAPDHWAIIIQDDGAGMTREALAALQTSLARSDGQMERHSHIGLGNVYDRLRLIYGSQMRIDIESELSRGTRVTLLLPVRLPDANRAASIEKP